MGVVVALVAHAAFAAVQYEFIQTSRSDTDGFRPLDLSARATIDGSRSRVEFVSGNAYPPGTYVVSNDGAKRLHFVDPSQKTYTEVNMLTIASAIGMSNIKIENFESSVARLDDQILVAGIPSDHYRLTMTFDITVSFKGRPLKQKVRTEIDRWTTVRFGDVKAGLGSNLTGNAEIDALIQAETTKVSGFPLKESIRITAINQISKTAKSELKVPATVTLMREMTVTTIRETIADEAMFRVPDGYSRSDFADRVPKPQTQVLNLEPPSK
jgi:hypothetical protein